MAKNTNTYEKRRKEMERLRKAQAKREKRLARRSGSVDSVSPDRSPTVQESAERQPAEKQPAEREPAKREPAKSKAVSFSGDALQKLVAKRLEMKKAAETSHGS